MTSNRALAHVLAIAVATGVAGTITFASNEAHAQTDAELQQARDLFQEAYKDEQEKRYEEALDKFRRVAQVKESASVRYRIASVLEAMNRLREARDAYRACAAMKPSLPPNQQNIADSAAEKALAVDKKIPKVVVTVSGATPPADARVTIDGAPVPTGRPIEQDPGEHTVQATATGMKPFEQRITLPDNGSEIPATVAFESDKPVTGGGEEPTPKKNNTLAFIALGAGGVLLTTGIVLLVAREGQISDIETLCPNPSACPRANESAVRDHEDSANLFLPLGVGLSVVGAAAAGFGVYMLVKKPSAEPAPPAATGTASLKVSPQYVRGGGFVGLSGAF